MDKRRTIWTLLTVAALAVALSGAAENTADSFAEQALKRALVTFAAARALNGVISVVQSTEVGVGITVSVGQILDPINDLVETFSGVMLLASSSLGLQIVLLGIAASWGVTVALIVVSVFAIVTLWSPRLRNNKWAAVASRLLLIMLCIRFVIPVLIIGTNLVSDAFLASQQAQATAALEMASQEIEELNEDLEVSPTDEQSLVERLSAAIDESIAAVNISDRLQELKKSASQATEHIVDLIVLFVLQTIILPLAILWLLIQLFKGIATRWTQI